MMLLGLMLAHVAGAQAQDEQAALTEAPESAWSIQIEPAVWFAGFEGDLGVPGGSGTIDAGDLNLDSPRLSPAGEVHLRRGRWRLTLGGFGFSIDQTAFLPVADRIAGIALAAGDRVGTELDLNSFEATVGFDLWSRALGERADGGPMLIATISALGGVRLYDLDVNLRISAGGMETSAGGDQFFAEPIGGLKAELEIADRFSVDIQISAGYIDTGGTSSNSFDLILGFMWRPVAHVGAQMGYRLLTFDLEDGSGPGRLILDGSLAGLYWGVVVRF